MKTSNVKKVACVLLTLSIVFLCACGEKKPVFVEETTVAETTTAVQQIFTVKPNAVKKTETVYINTDSNGSVLNTIVSDWLHTDKAGVVVSDISSLKNIVNVKSDIQPIVSGNNLTWHMDSTDLYYRGSSDKTLPMSLQISYFIDGNELSADEIAGKSGKVEIRIKLINNIFETKKIQGQDIKVYNPIIIVGGLILPEGNFKNAAFENGKIIGDGSKDIAVMVGMPGMNETLGLDTLELGDLGEVKFTDTFSITADVNSFTLGNMYFAALPVSAIGAQINLPETLGELKTSLNQLKELESVIKTIDPQQLISSLIKDGDKLNSLVSLVDEAIGLYQSNKALLELIPKYMTDDNMEKLSTLFNDLQGSDVQQAIELLNNPIIKAFLKDLPELAENMQALAPIMSELSEDMKDPEVAKAVENLPQTLEVLQKIQTAYADNKELMDSLLKLMSEDNLEKIENLLKTAESGGLAEKLEEYGVLAENADSLIGRFSEMLNFGNSYKIFSEATEGTETAVMFIYQIASVPLPVVNDTEEEVTQPEGLFGKLFKLV